MSGHFLRLGLIPAYLVFCLVLGGASAAGFWANMVLQLLAIPILYWALVVTRSAPMATAGRQLMLLLVLMLLLIVIQLVPLPPSVWSALPGREDAVAGFRLLGEPLPWLPLSLAPRQTLASALWLLPAVAVLLGIVKLGGYQPKWMAWGIAAVTAVGVSLGALQVTGGAESGWYLYRITNYGVNVGFFSNANHMATLLVCTIPFLAALYLAAGGRSRSAQKASGTFVILFGALAVVGVGLVINGSLAGIGLAVAVAAASLVMVRSRKTRMPVWAMPLLLLLAGAAVVAPFVLPFQNNLTSAEAQFDPNSRYNSFRTNIGVAGDHMPVGSGVGSFGVVYPRYEDPEAVNRIYLNHVHNDYIELALETGAPGLLLIALFLLWWGRRAIAVWSGDEVDYFARAASIASAAILVHSLVDYPLRTAAISALFAACCALMADPRPRTKRRRSSEAAPRARHLSAD